MGLFDRLRIEDCLDITLPGFEGDPTAVTWQTKSLYPPAMDNYKVTMEGRLYYEQTRTEEVPVAERPLYDDNIGGFESDLQRLAGSRRTVHLGWTDTAYHRTLEFHRSIDDEWYAYEATFTHGDLALVQRVQRSSGVQISEGAESPSQVGGTVKHYRNNDYLDNDLLRPGG